MVGGYQHPGPGGLLCYRAQAFVQQGYVAGRFGMLWAVGVHRVVGGGQVHQVEVLPRHGVAPGVQHPAVDLQGVDGRRLAYAVNHPAGRLLGGYADSGAVAEQAAQLVLRRDQKGTQTAGGGPLEHGLGEEELAGLHVELFAALPVEPIVGCDAMPLRVAASDQRHVVDVGDAGRHAAPIHLEAAPRHFSQVGSRAGVQILRVEPVDEHYYGGNVHCQNR